MSCNYVALLMKESLAIASTCGEALATLQCDLLAPEYEFLDPNPDLHSLFQEYNCMFFEGRLAGCEVKWSKRMTLCAGLCSFQPLSGFCSIRLSEPLLRLRPRSDMVNTLLHEMIHAYVFVATPVRDHEDHGPLFQSHLNRINNAAKTKITVFHTFHDEVDSYRQHIWQCNGSCQRTPPFFGLVKRSINRVPGPTDRWWASHARNCGGTYVKIKEPAAFKAKQAKKRERDSARAVKIKKKKKEKDPPSEKHFFSIKQGGDVHKNTIFSVRADPKAPRAEEKQLRLSGLNRDGFKKPTKEQDRDNKGSERPMFKVPRSASVMLSLNGHEDAYYVVGDMRALFQTSDSQAFCPDDRERNWLKFPATIQEPDNQTNKRGTNPIEEATVVDLASDDSEQLNEATRLSQLKLPCTNLDERVRRNEGIDVIEID